MQPHVKLVQPEAATDPNHLPHPWPDVYQALTRGRPLPVCQGVVVARVWHVVTRALQLEPQTASRRLVSWLSEAGLIDSADADADTGAALLSPPVVRAGRAASPRTATLDAATLAVLVAALEPHRKLIEMLCSRLINRAETQTERGCDCHAIDGCQCGWAEAQADIDFARGAADAAGVKL